MDTYRLAIDAGLIEDPGPCQHDLPADTYCPYCEIDNLKQDNAAMDTQLDEIAEAISDCHEALKQRQHGGVAEQKLRHDLERIMNQPYDG